jgi:UDP-N-acetyl-D-mannosaminuronate dehydrogenase
MVCEVVGDEDLVIIELTIYPGLCEDIVLPILNKSGKNIHLAHYPERINPGGDKT